jgi:hypothetical protein
MEGAFESVASHNCRMSFSILEICASTFARVHANLAKNHLPEHCPQED